MGFVLLGLLTIISKNRSLGARDRGARSLRCLKPAFVGAIETKDPKWLQNHGGNLNPHLTRNQMRFTLLISAKIYFSLLAILAAFIFSLMMIFYRFDLLFYKNCQFLTLD